MTVTELMWIQIPNGWCAWRRCRVQQSQIAVCRWLMFLHNCG